VRRGHHVRVCSPTSRASEWPVTSTSLTLFKSAAGPAQRRAPGGGAGAGARRVCSNRVKRSRVATRRTQEGADGFARRSPRLYSIIVVVLAGCVLGGLSIVRELSGVRAPFIAAFAYAALGAGLWSLMTGVTFAEENRPRWWLAGFALAAVASTIAGFYLRD
jgi:hypothetical protein